MLIIGISGGTGSGKTTIVKQVIEHLSLTEVSVISQDSYYKETDHLTIEERALINFDAPAAIDFDLMIEHINALKKGASIEQPVYSFVTHNRTKSTTKTYPTKVMVVEGILILNNETLRDLLTIKIFVETDTDERLIRRIRRDTSERGRTTQEVLDTYQKVLKPMHKKHVEPTKKYADFIIPNNTKNTVAINIIKTIIADQL